jgi:uncharacterized membrane protein YphA (DoxX/SURF4 family)
MPELEPEKESERWAGATRVGFRFAFVLFALLYAPGPLDSVPVVDRVASVFLRGRLAFGMWVARDVLHLHVPPTGTYTGDGVVGWVLLGVEIVCAAVACGAWSVLDVRARAYPRLHEALRVYLRFMLAGVMLGYGIAKVFCLQFPVPSHVTLLRAYGESPPADLLWTFMGASPGYQVFGGLTEVLGATLLVFRRTVTLGALLLVGVLTNVVALNLFYDVGVKIYSLTLLATAVFLVLPETPRLLRFFLRAHSVPARRELQLFRWRHGLLAANLGKGAFLLGVAAPMAWRDYDASRAQRISSAGPLAGFYTADAPTDAPATSLRLTAVEFVGPYFYSRCADGRGARYLVTGYDAKSSTVTLYDRAHNASYALAAELREPELTLAGTVEGYQVDARLQRAAPSHLLLPSHGIRWVIEPR